MALYTWAFQSVMVCDNSLVFLIEIGTCDIIDQLRDTYSSLVLLVICPLYVSGLSTNLT